MGFDPKRTRKYTGDKQRGLAALQMWLEGHTYEQIATELEYHDRSSAWHAVQAAKKHLPDEAAEARDQAFNRIMEPLMKMRQLAIDGDPQAAGAHRQYEERISKMYGFDQPIKTDVTSDGEKITVQVVRDWVPSGDDTP